MGELPSGHRASDGSMLVLVVVLDPCMGRSARSGRWYGLRCVGGDEITAIWLLEAMQVYTYVSNNLNIRKRRIREKDCASEARTREVNAPTRMYLPVISDSTSSSPQACRLRVSSSHGLHGLMDIPTSLGSPKVSNHSSSFPRLLKVLPRQTIHGDSNHSRRLLLRRLPCQLDHAARLHLGHNHSEICQAFVHKASLLLTNRQDLLLELLRQTYHSPHQAAPPMIDHPPVSLHSAAKSCLPRQCFAWDSCRHGQGHHTSSITASSTYHIPSEQCSPPTALLPSQPVYGQRRYPIGKQSSFPPRNLGGKLRSKSEEIGRILVVKVREPDWSLPTTVDPAGSIWDNKPS